jgi:hypothetical protein
MAFLLLSILPATAKASTIGYEITHQIADLSVFHDGNLIDADQSAYWGLIGVPTPQSVGLRIEMSQDPTTIQDFPVFLGGIRTGTDRYYEFERIELLLDGSVVLTDTSPPLNNNSAQVIDEEMGASPRSDAFIMAYNNETAFGAGTLNGFFVLFSDSFATTADTWLFGGELPAADQLLSLSRPPAFSIDFTDPTGLEYALRSGKNTTTPTITMITVSTVPLPASLPLLGFATLVIASIGRMGSTPSRKV